MLYKADMVQEWRMKPEKPQLRTERKATFLRYICTLLDLRILSECQTVSSGNMNHIRASEANLSPLGLP